MKKAGNLIRPTNGPWNGETFNTADPIKEVPQKGWCLISGATSALSTLYLDGKPVPNVAALDLAVDAGSCPILTLKIVMPNMTVITKTK